MDVVNSTWDFILLNSVMQFWPIALTHFSSWCNVTKSGIALTTDETLPQPKCDLRKFYSTNRVVNNLRSILLCCVS